MDIMDRAVQEETIEGPAGTLCAAIVVDDMGDHDPRRDMTNGCRIVDWNRDYRIATGSDDIETRRDYMIECESFGELVRKFTDGDKVYVVRGYNVADYGSNGGRLHLHDADDWRDWRDWRDWDGFAYVCEEDFATVGRNESMTTREQGDALIAGDLGLIDNVLQGEVYGWVVVDETGDMLDSCWGYYGEIDYPMSEARDAAQWHHERAAELAEAVRSSSIMPLLIEA